ncbi:MAG TPA: homocysteine S-methyltransferase family protein [Chthonomonadales bacterium]|nr:homocysteine S-methyltransferase family protein [Chthonomonadales bacterium]
MLRRLLGVRPVLLDGAWGTRLQECGLPIGACPDAWNLTDPGQVEALARAYVESGSAAILTNTFGANRYALERHGLADRAADIAREGAGISLRAAVGRACVVASIGPSGRMLAMGEVSEAELAAAFYEQARALRDAGVEAAVVETMSDVEEAAIAVQAAVRAGLDVVATMVFYTGRDGDRTMMGQTPEEAATALRKAGASVIGANCGKGAEQIVPICRRLRAATDLPLWVKLNAGLPELVEGRAVYRTGPEEWAGQMLSLIAAGADFVGGCCGTTPAHIAALAKALRN